MPPSIKENGGFSLLEATIVLGILGVLLSLLWPYMRELTERAETQKVSQNKERVLYALANFIRQKGHLPCPSDPKATRNMGIAQKRCKANSTGLVPFQSLGLSRQHATGYGKNLMQYTVNPSLTESPPRQRGEVGYYRIPCTPMPVIDPPQTADPTAVILMAIPKRLQRHCQTEEQSKTRARCLPFQTKIGRHHLAAYYGRLLPENSDHTVP
jgi:type II secretory pathway pseudopilin PulG